MKVTLLDRGLGTPVQGQEISLVRKYIPKGSLWQAYDYETIQTKTTDINGEVVFDTQKLSGKSKFSYDVTTSGHDLIDDNIEYPISKKERNQEVTLRAKNLEYLFFHVNNLFSPASPGDHLYVFASINNFYNWDYMPGSTFGTGTWQWQFETGDMTLSVFKRKLGNDTSFTISALVTSKPSNTITISW
ncbi:MAG TPA: hypothetical protein PLQ93_11895 [Bacteroidia bacterium]|nr:hypothetical protein [Bacteroidia bacterium]